MGPYRKEYSRSADVWHVFDGDGQQIAEVETETLADVLLASLCQKMLEQLHGAAGGQLVPYCVVVRVMAPPTTAERDVRRIVSKMLDVGYADAGNSEEWDRDTDADAMLQMNFYVEGVDL